MAVTQIGSSYSGAQEKNAGTGDPAFNVSVTVPSGTDLLVVNISLSTNAASNGIYQPTFNGSNLTLWTQIRANRAHIYYMINPPVGTYNLYVSGDVNNGGGMCAYTHCYSGVDTSSPFSGFTNRGWISGYTATTAAMPSVANSQLVLVGDRTYTGTQTPPALGATSPAVVVNYKSAGGDNDTGSYDAVWSGTVRQSGTGGNLSFSLSSPYGLDATYYSYNILPKLGVPTRAIFFS